MVQVIQMTDKKEKSPAFQFYPKDFMTDGKVICMTPEERGLYVWLLCVDWLEDGFPEDLILKLSGYQWHKSDGSLRDDSSEILATLKACFIKHPKKQGMLTNARLLKTRKLQEERHLKAVESGSRGGKAKYINNLQNLGSLEGGYDSATSKSLAKASSSSSTSSSNIYKKPTLKEVEDYFKEKDISLSASAFFDYYEARGWMIGKSKIKKWKSCVSTWLRNEKTFGGKNGVDKQETARNFTTVEEYQRLQSERHPEEGQIRFKSRQPKEQTS